VTVQPLSQSGDLFSSSPNIFHRYSARMNTSSREMSTCGFVKRAVGIEAKVIFLRPGCSVHNHCSKIVDQLPLHRRYHPSVLRLRCPCIAFAGLLACLFLSIYTQSYIHRGRSLRLVGYLIARSPVSQLYSLSNSE